MMDIDTSLSSSMAAFTFASRRAEGTRGRKVVVTTNCYRVSIMRKLSFHHYHVIETVPSKREIKNKARRTDILKKLYIHQYPQVFQPGQVVFDGKAGLYTSKNLGPDTNLHFDVHERHGDGGKDTVVRVQLQRVGLISENDFNTLLNQNNEPDRALTAQQILNLLLYNAMPEEYRKVTTRNTMFDLADKQPLPMGLIFVRGCFASVRLAREHLLLNVDVCSVIMHESMKLHDIAMLLLDLKNVRELENPAYLDRTLSAVKKIRVRQVGAGKIGRIRTIKTIIHRAGYETFHNVDVDVEMTVREYFLRTYRYALKYPNIPGVVVHKKNNRGEDTDQKDVIPFELLEVVEGQFYRRKVDPMITQRVQQLSVVHPLTRKRHIEENLQAFNPEALSLAGLHVDRNMLSIHGRILPAPAIKFRNHTLNPRSGEWKIPKKHHSSPANAPFLKPCVIHRWAVLIYERTCEVPFVGLILDTLIEKFQFYGIDSTHLLRKKNITVLSRESPQGDKEMHVRDVLAKTASGEGKGTLTEEDLAMTLLLVILPAGKGSNYEEIKRLGDTDAKLSRGIDNPGLITQCLSWDKLAPFKDRERKAEAYLTNVVLKINTRMGGVNFYPNDPGLDWLYRTKDEVTMVIGELESALPIDRLDVSHPAPGVFRPSMAGMVFSVDVTATQYYPHCSYQPPRVERIMELRGMLEYALQKFAGAAARLYNKYLLPSRFVIYRDGLSDGELSNVAAKEIEDIRAAIKHTWVVAPGNCLRKKVEDIRITYVVVGKRHHIRFFPGKNEGDESGNCPSGFVTDDKKITNPHVYDFFLLSHGGLLGTSRPAHYMVMLDENSLTADELQSMTFGLCHTFARATRAVSVPAPVYYAHLVCRRANIHIRYKDDMTDLSSGTEYDEKDWTFAKINHLQSRLMYYI